jgi:hypothetical protein
MLLRLVLASTFNNGLRSKHIMSLITSLIGPVAHLLDKHIPDADTKQQLAHEIATMSEAHAHELATAQLEVNKKEAEHASWFVSGWRPATGWVCVLGMACNFLLIPMANFALALAESKIVVPVLDLAVMMPVLLGMLGLGGLRSYEKKHEVARR